MGNFTIKLLPGETVVELAKRLTPIYGANAIAIAKQHVDSMVNDAKWQTYKRRRLTLQT